MRSAITKHSLKLRLLAFVLALALVWYSLNPAPGPIARIHREDEWPDEKKREVEPQLQRAVILSIVIGALETDSADRPLLNQDEDDFDWPEFIDG